MFTRNEELLSLHKFKQMTSGLGMYFFLGLFYGALR